MKYKRLTKKGGWHENIDLKDECGYNPFSRIYQRLAELEDKLENGTLIELPCKETTLYFIYNKPFANKPILTPKIHETSNWYFDIDKKGVAIVARNPYAYNGDYFYYLGERVFLTKAEAEKKLKELKEDL